MGASNLSDPHVLLAELKSRQDEGQDLNDLLAHIVTVVETATTQRHPDYWVCQRLVLWARFPELVALQIASWRLTPEQRAAISKAFESLAR